MKRSTFSIFWVWIVMIAWQQSNQSKASEKLSFNRDIRPILSSACFRCHGFDEKTREVDLRLDAAEAAFADRDNGNAIIPNDPEQSLIWKRIVSTDADTVMPPPDSNHQLDENEKALIKQWILEGAVYQQHWAFEPIALPSPPSQENLPNDWKSSTIDHFLFSALEKKGLSIQPQADRATLIRRVAFTLTGLPPTVAEVAQFESDASETAYEAMVDRYLNSPRYGEEMARHWLDIARYGDTHGLHLDNERQMWAFRDWVVSAFNSNLPFSQFTIDQIAGDLLPSPTQEQMVATGFNRCNVTTSEGGAINEEFQFRYAVDRASTTVQAWMGLTAGCAVCHDHKYDPITTRDFYAMYAFFYSAADPAMDGNIAKTAPFIRLATKAQEERLATIRGQLADVEKRLSKESREGVGFPSGSVDKNLVNSDQQSITEVWIDDELPLGATQKNTSRNDEVWVTDRDMDIPMGRRALKQAFGNKYELTIKDFVQPLVIPNDANLQVWLRLDEHQPSESAFIELKTDKGTKKWSWKSEERTSNSSTPAKLSNKVLPEPGKWTLMQIDSQELSAEITAGAEVLEIKLGQFGGICFWDGLQVNGTSMAASDPRRDVDAWWTSRKGKSTRIASRELDKILKDGPPSKDTAGDSQKIDTQNGSEESKKPVDASQPNESEELSQRKRKQVLDFYHAYITNSPSDAVKIIRNDLAKIRLELAMVEAEIPGTFVFGESSTPKQAFVMKRGQYDQPGEPVEPATLSMLPALKSTEQVEKADAKANRLNRLDLARWLLSDSNPLTARVIVNRFWQQVFGVGIVKTSDDFGSQGSQPSHPELLDWLAHDFRSSGWDVKALMKQLLTSQAFRQRSYSLPTSLELDPENRFLSRGPRIRLDAEQIRDNVLMTSGLLDLTMGGPGVKIYQPPNIWEPVGYGDSNTRYYLQDFGSKLYRRSLYSFIKRTAPPPFMSNFDAPNRELFCSRRERSNTPLQALQLMNDTQHVEAAKQLGQRIILEGGSSSEDRIRFAYKIVLARLPKDKEEASVLGLLKHYQERFADSPADAKSLANVGESRVKESVDMIELASYTMIANLILNLDETINRN